MAARDVSLSDSCALSWLILARTPSNTFSASTADLQHMQSSRQHVSCLHLLAHRPTDAPSTAHVLADKHCDTTCAHQFHALLYTSSTFEVAVNQQHAVTRSSVDEHVAMPTVFTCCHVRSYCSHRAMQLQTALQTAKRRHSATAAQQQNCPHTTAGTAAAGS
jgi:hypothetical protein